MKAFPAEQTPLYPVSPSRMTRFFDAFSTRITRFTGRPIAFISALLIVILWACSRPLFPKGQAGADSWNFLINTGTTIITFLMVFLIQQSQNKDTVALHLKLNELIAANKDASNRLINIEDLTDDELTVLKKFYIHLAKTAEEDRELFTTHSIDEAKHNHNTKIAHKRSRMAQRTAAQKPVNGKALELKKPPVSDGLDTGAVDEN